VQQSGQRRLLPVCTIELVQIARDALLDLPHSPLHFGAREIPVPDLGTVLDKGADKGRANATGAAGDDHRSAFE
jgi:hypothetical protein